MRALWHVFSSFSSVLLWGSLAQYLLVCALARCLRFPPGFWAVTWEPRRYVLTQVSVQKTDANLGHQAFSYLRRETSRLSPSFPREPFEAYPHYSSPVTLCSVACERESGGCDDKLDGKSSSCSCGCWRSSRVVPVASRGTKH